MTTQEIKALQDSLVKLGYMTQDQVNTGYGTYGPRTTSAYAAYQADIDKAARTNPVVSKVVPTTQTYDQFMAANGGDIRNAVNPNTGQPFTNSEQQSALSQATNDLDPAFQAQKQKDQQDTEASLAAKQADYEQYLANQGQLFSSDKATQDQTAANQGVLFSGGRAQKLQQLQDTYARNAAYQGKNIGADIGNTARDFQYKYGNDTAGTLSQYYNLPGQNYNAQAPTGGVSRGGLSSVYNPSGSNFQGTAVNANKANANIRAAGLLWNKANKLVQGGYKNQY